MVSESRIKTNHCLMKAFDLNDFLDPNKLTHDELQYYNNLTRALDQTIDKYVDWLGTLDAQKIFYENDKYTEEFFNSIDLELDEIINDTSLSVDKIVEKIYNKGLNQGYKDIRRRFHFSDACKYGLKATQEYNFELITNVSNDLRNTIKHHIFRGVAEGQSIHEVARAITDSGLEPLHGKSMSAYQRASLIAHTEIARSMTTGRLQAYANYGVEKVKILTAEDGKVCPICLEAAYVFNKKNKVFGEHLGERVYSIEDASDLIPFHPGCRCTVIAHIEHYQDIPKNNPQNSKFSKPFEEPLEDPIIIVLTGDLKRKPLRDFDDLLDGDINIKDKLKSFIRTLPDNTIEHLSIWDVEGNRLINQITNSTSFHVDIPNDIKLIGLSEGGFLMSIHNHPIDGCILPSHGDLMTMANNKIKYGLTVKGNRAILVKNKETFRNQHDYSIKEICKRQQRVELQIKRDFIQTKDGGELLSDLNSKLAKGTITEEEYKNQFYSEVETFAEENIVKYCEMLNNELSGCDMEISIVELENT